MDQVEIGSIFAGHRIESVAGRGGMGVVYVATHLALDRRVALKVIAPELSGDESFRARFKQESMTAASIDHPNVIPIYHAGEEDEKLYITMRYVEGTDLRAMISEHGRIEPHTAARIVSEVASALDAAHARGLVHRDVKPANVLIGRGGQAYLTDFGLTKHASQSGMTKTGMFVGTLDYIAPEQLQGGEVDARVDVYALGCVLYQALTGNVPYPRDSEPAKIWAHMQEPPPSVTATANVPPQFEDVVQRAMAKDPDDRFLSAGDLGRAALAAAESRGIAGGSRSVATGDAAPSGVTAVPLPPPSAAGTQGLGAPRPTAGQSLPPSAPPPSGVPAWHSAPPPQTPPGGWAQPSTGGGPAPRRNLLPFAIAGAALVVIAAILAVVLSSGGGGSDKPTPTVAVNTVTAPTTPTTTTPGGDEQAKTAIQLTLTTTLKAARQKSALVFCGGLALNYQRAQFGGPIECENAAKKGNIPSQFKSASDAASSTTITGNKATVITVDGTTFQFVQASNTWTISGVG